VRIAQLRKEFSAFPDFVVEQIEKGNDLKSAKAEFADLMRKKNEELSAENARLVAESKKQPIVGAQPVKLADGENNAQLEARSFIEMARELKAKTGKPLHVCMSEVSIRNPAAYAAQDANLQAKKEQVAKVAASRGRQTVN
jgi:methionine salvage enolase-phosphatase E1